MDRKQAIKLVKRYKKEISRLIKPTAVYLYGSYSRDEARDDSDIDVAVVINGREADWLSLSSQLWRAGCRVSSLIEPVLIDETRPSPLYDTVKRDGIAI